MESFNDKKRIASSDHGNHNKKTKVEPQLSPSSLLPITLLGGFLGSGKTTLLKHILESKHDASVSEGGNKAAFKCAVIVNDVAELNIDKALIDQSSFVQSDEVIAMENGCVCCTLQSDLIDQIMQMATKGDFDYMIIEASGVSEPSEIARLFEKCDDDHDHSEEHGENLALSDVARLDTCVTLVDAADFFNKLKSIDKGNDTDSWSKLMVEQIEYSNVIVINKVDLVSQTQIDQIKDHLAVLNPNARVLTAKHSTINVDQVVDTKLYKAEDFDNILPQLVEMEEVKECCKSSEKRGEPPCCKKARTIDSGLSQVMLRSKNLSTARHEARFGITSFIYKAKRPFHSSRLHEDFIEKYFMFIAQEEEEEEEEEEVAEEVIEDDAKLVDKEDMNVGEKDGKNSEINEVNGQEIKRQQEEADARAKSRMHDFGNILRSKGFLWTPHTHDYKVTFGQAGNTVNMEFSEEQWKVLDKRAWVGSDEEKALFQKEFDIVDPWGDRCQSLVFIGHNIDHMAIQKTLDHCLLTDAEFSMGVDGWKAIVGDILLG